MQAGTQVRIKVDPARKGVITGKHRNRAGRTYWQVSFVDGLTDFILEAQLEIASNVPEDPVDLFKNGNFGRARDLRGNLTYIRLNGRLANLIYSMETTNTDFYAYQFKPVVNFLESPGDGILIADEVGLGKTIEAGLIWTELRSRFDARRLMVLCPAMLVEKWRSELLVRFGIDAEVADATQAQQRFTEFRNGQRFDYTLVCSMQGLRPRRGWDSDSPKSNASSNFSRYLNDSAEQEPLLDLLIIDEAHYMRNPETMTSKLGHLLRSISAHVVLLSATPVHLRSRDLYQLLNLVDEATFNQPGVFDFILDANRPLLQAREAILRNQTNMSELLELLEQAQQHPLLSTNRQLAKLVEILPTKTDLSDYGFRSQLANRLEKINLLDRIVNRTRKREVEEWRVMREVVAEEIVPTEVEQVFYEKITTLVREYCEERETHEGFLLVTPQRQMSSSMPAALREWRNKRSVHIEEIYEDRGIDDVEIQGSFGPLVSELVRHAYEFADFDMLWVNDSKYKRLRLMVKRYLTESPNEKIVLFAYFRPTLAYLAERLRKDGISCITLTGQDGTEKQAIIDRFRDSREVAVLLSSEVASEGVDLQFSRVVINYDLPWNPMKVEQRIGRIDRLGQQSPKITVWNLFYAETIDSRIYNRLYKRLGIFEHALGGLEPILGDKITTLTMDLLRNKLSPGQEEERIDQTAFALENYRLQEDELETEAGNLIAHGDFILNQVRAARDLERWIIGEDIWVYVRDFFSKHYPGCDFKQLDSKELVFDVKLSSEARFDFDRYLKFQRLFHQTRLATNISKGVRCAFKNKPRGTTLRNIEFITQLHPLVRFVTSRLRETDESYYPTVSVSLHRELMPSVKPGAWVFTVNRWSVEGLRDIERLNYLSRLADGSGDFLHDDDSERLVTAAARSGADWLDIESYINLSETMEVVNTCLDEAESRYERFVEDLEQENNDRADIREQSLKRHWTKQRENLEQTLERHHALGRDHMIPATEGRITHLNDRMDERLLKIKVQRKIKHHKHEVSIGLIYVK